MSVSNRVNAPAALSPLIPQLTHRRRRPGQRNVLTSATILWNEPAWVMLSPIKQTVSVAFS